MIQNIANRFLERLVTERVNRDTAFNCLGNFAENSLIEHVYRYWLETVLAFLDLLFEHHKENGRTLTHWGTLEPTFARNALGSNF